MNWEKVTMEHQRDTGTSPAGSSDSLLQISLEDLEQDVTTRLLGDFGRWQLKISILMSLLKLPSAWYQLNIIFMAPPQDFWCQKPNLIYKCSEEEWRRICSPNVEENPCLIFDPDLLLGVPDMDKTLIPLVPCTKFVYDTRMFKRTIVSDWNLVCKDHYLVHLCQIVMMWGVLLGGVIFGIAADRYGRRTPLILAITVQGVASFFASFIPWFWIFLVNWFLLALANGGNTVISFVMCMEAVSGRWRTIIPVLYQLPFGLGNAVMAGLAYWLRDWRKLEFALAFISSLYIMYYFCIPESPRWLLATGKKDKALDILLAAAKENGRHFSRKRTKMLLDRHSLPADHSHDPGFIAFLKSKNMRTKTILLSINWFCTGACFYIFAQYLGSIGSNVFLAVALTGIISAIGGFTCVFVICIVGRKTTIIIYQIITTLCLVAIILVPKGQTENDWGRLLFASIGFGGMAGALPALYLFSAELFPTIGRNVGLSGVIIFARFASMIAPLVVTLQTIIADLPIFIVGMMSFFQIFVILPLPETKNIRLPETLEQAERI